MTRQPNPRTMRGTGDYDPPDDYDCPGCESRDAEADRLREQLDEVRATCDEAIRLHDEIEAERDRLMVELADVLEQRDALARRLGLAQVTP